MSKCYAKHCPEDELKGNNFFCPFHWDILPQPSKKKLADAFGSEEWVPTLKIVLQEMILAEGDFLQSQEQGPSGAPGQVVPPPAPPPKRAAHLLPPPVEPPKRHPGVKRNIAEDGEEIAPP